MAPPAGGRARARVSQGIARGLIEKGGRARARMWATRAVPARMPRPPARAGGEWAGGARAVSAARARGARVVGRRALALVLASCARARGVLAAHGARALAGGRLRFGRMARARAGGLRASVRAARARCARTSARRATSTPRVRRESAASASRAPARCGRAVKAGPPLIVDRHSRSHVQVRPLGRCQDGGVPACSRHNGGLHRLAGACFVRGGWQAMVCLLS